MTMVSTERLAELFVELADALVDEFDLVEFLHDLADHVVSVTSATAVGLMLADERGKLHYIASSADSEKHLELMRMQYDGGPSRDCFDAAEAVVVTDLRLEVEHWPGFVPRALELGVHSVHAFPMRLRERCLGALNVFGDGPLPVDPADIKVIQAMADIATISVFQERAISNAELLTEQLQGALNSRIVVEQAKGMVARQAHVTVDEAFTVIRSHARSRRLRLVDLAADIVNRHVELPLT